MSLWRIKAVVAVITNAMALFCGGLAFAIMLLIAMDVIRRGLTSRVIPGTLEYTEVGMVALVFLGLAYAQACGSHIGVDFVVDRLSRRWARVVRIAGQLTTVGIMGWIIVETTKSALASYAEGEYRFGLAQVPVWPARFAIPLGLFAYLLQLVVSLIDEFVPRDPPAARADRTATP